MNESVCVLRPLAGVTILLCILPISSGCADSGPNISVIPAPDRFEPAQVRPLPGGRVPDMWDGSLRSRLHEDAPKSTNRCGTLPVISCSNSRLRL
jgi:hypothetical protein